MDSGCSFHMCPYKHWFQDLAPSNGTVLLGNNQICNVKGVGSVKFRMADGLVKLLSDVRYIPEIKRNHVSLGLLETKGFYFTSKNGKMEVRKGDKVFMTAERKNSLYYLLGEVMTGEVNSVSTESLKLWHMPLGHPAEGSVKELVRKGLISADASSKLDPCEQCILSKSKKLPYPTGIHTSTAPLDYIHSDRWGPAPVATVGGGKLTYSDFTWF